MVAGIAAGKIKGIAPEADLLSALWPTSGYVEDLDSVFNWFIQNDVDVINSSFGWLTNGEYSYIDSYVDYIVDIYDISFVQAAGNTGGDLVSPGLAYNVITVGSLEFDAALSSFSSYQEDDESITQKPEIVAKGHYRVDFDNLCVYEAGTSYSAPAVTGTIAAMIDKDSSLKSNPSQVKAILTTYADSSNLTTYSDFTNGLEEKVGAGELDVNNSINNTDKSFSHVVSSWDSNGDVLYTKAEFISTGSKIRITLWWNIHAIKISNNVFNYDPINLDLKLDSEYDGIYCSSTSTSYNYEIIDCNLYGTQDYYIQVILNDIYNQTEHYGIKFGVSYKIY